MIFIFWFMDIYKKWNNFKGWIVVEIIVEKVEMKRLGYNRIGIYVF